MPHGDLLKERERQDASGPRLERSSEGDRPSPATVGFTKTERLLLCLRYADGLNDEEISVLTRTSVVEVQQALASLVDRVRAHLAVA